MKVVTPEEMASIERAADAGGQTYAEMMQRAGEATAREALAIASDETAMLVLCGPGNNGGDGLVAARLLAEAQHSVLSVVWNRAEDDLLASAKEAGVRLIDVPADGPIPDDFGLMLTQHLEDSGVLIDALFGTGLGRPIEGTAAELVRVIRSAVLSSDEGGRTVSVVAVDVPSGLLASSGRLDPHTIPADVTITFGFPKVGHLFMPGAEWIGRLVVDPIGISVSLADSISLEMVTGDQLSAALPARPVDGHKGTFGHVLVVGGSMRYTGAPGLSAEAAYRAGAGLVTLAIPRVIHSAIAARLPEAIFLPLPDDGDSLDVAAAESIREAQPDADVILVGPGLTTGVGAAAVFEALIEAAPNAAIGTDAEVSSDDDEVTGEVRPNQRRFVIDADGLSLLAADPERLQRLPAGSILTPHPGEMARLVSAAPAEGWSADRPLEGIERLSAARMHAVAWNQVIVLKGAYTVVAEPGGRAAIIPFATSALSTAGTGDVLAGLIAGLLAGGAEPFDAAWCGAWIQGYSGMLVRNRIGPRAAMATDVLNSIGRALAAVEIRGDRSVKRSLEA